MPSADRREPLVAAGSDLYYALLYCPPPRAAVAALLAWHERMLRLLLESSEETVVLAQLQWWHEELARLAQGLPRHPLTRMVHEAGHAAPAAAALRRALEAAVGTAQAPPAADADGLAARWLPVGAPVWRLAAELLAGTAPDAVSRLGALTGAAAALRSLPRQRQTGRLALAPELATPARVREASAALAAALDEAHAAVPPALGRALLPMLTLAAITARTLRAQAAPDVDPTRERIALTPLSKLLLARRERRRARRR